MIATTEVSGHELSFSSRDLILLIFRPNSYQEHKECGTIMFGIIEAPTVFLHIVRALSMTLHADSS